ncbi:MAG: response regulator transcription factor [Acidimicrobiales bacterium]
MSTFDDHSSRTEPGGGAWLARILLVEDDLGLASAIKVGLEAEYYSVTIANDGEAALRIFENERHDLVLLDLLLPGISGLEVCREILSCRPETEIIMITALGELQDTVAGLEFGADDYLVKPFVMSELKARMHAVLRRGSHTVDSLPPIEVEKVSTVMAVGALLLDVEHGHLYYHGRLIHTRPRELEVLELFFRRPGLVLSRTMVESVLSTGSEAISRATVDWHIRQIRQRLQSEIGVPLIETVYGIGWRLDPRAAI